MKKGTIWMSLGLILMIAAFALTAYNIWDEARAGEESSEVIEELTEKIKESEEESADGALYMEYPDMEMSTVLIGSERYVGILEIPMLGIKLPVMDS